MLALSKEENPTVFQKTLGLNDFYFGSDDFEYPLGNIQMVGKSSAPMFRGEKPLETKLAPTRTLESTARHAVDFWLSTEDLPRPENRVTLDRDGDRPAQLQAHQPGAREAPLRKAQVDARRSWGCTSTTSSRATPTSRTTSRSPACAHQAGTCRFGTDPETSVLDTDCRAHELDNLYVVDTSFFPSIGAVNPALTAMANALRVGDHLLERLGAGSGRRGAGECRLSDGSSPAPRVVIIGGGFGGLAAARRLRHADVDVTLIDRTNHHLFQPLLYQVAAGALSPSDCAAPIRPSLKRSANTTVLMDEATDVDPERRQVVLDRRRPARLRQPDRGLRRAYVLLRP